MTNYLSKDKFLGPDGGLQIQVVCRFVHLELIGISCIQQVKIHNAIKLCLL